MWAGAERNLLREAPQGHRRKPSATLRGSARARARERPVWQPRSFERAGPPLVFTRRLSKRDLDFKKVPR